MSATRSRLLLTGGALALCCPLLGCRPPLPVRLAPAAVTDFWELPSAAVGSQRLFRLSGRVEADSVRLKVALRLAQPEDFELVAFDAFGRRRWSLRVDGGRALWLDHRERWACSLGASDRAPEAIPIPLPLTSLPRLLLGRAPFEPSSPPAAEELPSAVRDHRGREWKLRFDGAGRLVAWSGADDRGALIRWWREDGESSLVAEGSGVELRWSETASEPLPQALSPTVIPAGYRRQRCADSR